MKGAAGYSVQLATRKKLRLVMRCFFLLEALAHLIGDREEGKES